MFFLLNKEKMKSYLVSVSTVLILLAMSVVLGDKTINKNETIQTKQVYERIEENRY